jgi:hypothetical protein
MSTMRSLRSKSVNQITIFTTCALFPELRKETPRQQPFRRACGAVRDDPLAPGLVELHQPHVMAASRDRR